MSKSAFFFRRRNRRHTPTMPTYLGTPITTDTIPTLLIVSLLAGLLFAAGSNDLKENSGAARAVTVASALATLRVGLALGGVWHWRMRPPIR